MAKTTWSDLRSEYEGLWASCKLDSAKVLAARSTARKIVAGKDRYLAVSDQTDVPWFVIGLIHAMECGLSWKGHLHNGDSLQKRTWQVPAGRPKTGSPPFTWEESAIDAIRYDGLDRIDAWTPARLCFELEGFNGWGYRKFHPEVKSPYLWSGTNHYKRGKYVADGKWSASAVSGQSGAIAILKCAMEMDPSIGEALAQTADGAGEVHETTEAPQHGPLPKVSRKASWLTRLRLALNTIIGGFSITSVLDYLGLSKSVIGEVRTIITDNATAILIGVAILGVCVVTYVLRLMDEDVKDGRYVPSGSVE
jgi:lysozyme family protein